jgi:hypothetical protein
LTSFHNLVPEHSHIPGTCLACLAVKRLLVLGETGLADTFELTSFETISGTQGCCIGQELTTISQSW